MKRSLFVFALGMLGFGCGSGSDGTNGINGVGFQGPVGPAGPQGAPADVSALTFGSAIDNVVISGNVDWSNATAFANSTGHQPGDYTFGNLTVSPGAFLVVPTGVTIRCSGQLQVGTGAQIAVKPPTLFPFATDIGTVSMAGTQAVTGVLPTPGRTTLGLSDPYPSLVLPLVAGGSGSAIELPGSNVVGGRGGGTLAIRAKGGVVNQGTLNVIGQDAFGLNGVTTGGGGGGLIFVIWGSGSTFNNTGGTITAAGGAAGLTQANNQAGAGGGGGGFIRLVGPGAGTVGGTLTVAGGLGSPAQGAPPAGTKVSPGGASQGNGGGVNTAGNGSNGTAGLVVRTDVTDPTAILSLNKSL